jgi:hypothetical protein
LKKRGSSWIIPAAAFSYFLIAAKEELVVWRAYLENHTKNIINIFNKKSLNIRWLSKKLHM